MGMHHWGPKQLEIGMPHYCKHEPGNPYDSNAISVYRDMALQRKVAYLRRGDAMALARVIDYAVGSVYLKAKDSATKFGRKGPQQICNVGFKVMDKHVDIVRKELGNSYEIKIF